MPRLTTDSLAGLPSFELPATGSPSESSTAGDGVFGELLRQATSTAGPREESTVADTPGDRSRPDSQPAKEPEDVESGNDRAKAADEAAPPESDDLEQLENEPKPADDNSEEPEPEPEPEPADTESEQDQPNEGEEGEAVNIQAANELKQLVDQVTVSQTDVEGISASESGDNKDPGHPRQDTQADAQVEQSTNETAKQVATDITPAESRQRQDEPAREAKSLDDTPSSGELDEATTTKVKASSAGNAQHGNDTTAGSPSESMVDSVDRSMVGEQGQTVSKPLEKDSRTNVKASGREVRNDAEQGEATVPAAELSSATKPRPNAATGPAIAAAATLDQAPAEQMSAATADGGTETNSGAAKPIQSGVAQTDGGQTARGSATGAIEAGSNADGQVASESGQVDRVRFVRRVARAFDAAATRNGSVRMRLHPPELGSLHLEVSVRNGQMTARLETETQTARTLILDNLPALRDRLAQQNIKVQQFDVDLMGNSADGSPQSPEDHSFSRDHMDRRASSPAVESQPESEESPGPRAVTRPGEGTRLNVVV